jgi:twinkle protein
MISPTQSEIALDLALHIDRLVEELPPGGRRRCYNRKWRCGSVAGESGNSLGVHLVGHKRGVRSDCSTWQRGDALDLVCAEP